VASRDRNKVAAAKVDQYFDQLVTGKSRLRPLPSALAGLLRDRSEYKIYGSGLKRAVELAEAERSKADTTKAPLKPATGPAPIPGVAPDTSHPTPKQPARPAPRADSAAAKPVQ
jgi:hypothetical protein